MAADVGSLAVAVIALLITFNPQTSNLCLWLFRHIYILIYPSADKCTSFIFRDLAIPDLRTRDHVSSPPTPRLHGDATTICTCPICAPPLYHRAHKKLADCWINTLFLAFKELRPGEELEPKPKPLSLRKKYIKTDGQTIIAYFIMTTKVGLFRETMLKSERAYVQLRKKDGLTLAHLGPPERVLDVTQSEMQKLLDGWPPFYRERFTSFEGHQLRNPIRTFDEIRRPSWMICIGLGEVQPAAVYIQEAPIKEDIFETAIRRARTVLNDHFKTRWGYDQSLLETIEDIEYFDREGTTGYRRDFSWAKRTLGQNEIVAYPGLHHIEAKDCQLTLAECNVLIDVFHKMEVTDDDAVVILPRLRAMLRRIRIGLFIAKKYTATHRRIIRPPELENDQDVYLESCV